MVKITNETYFKRIIKAYGQKVHVHSVNFCTPSVQEYKNSSGTTIGLITNCSVNPYRKEGEPVEPDEYEIAGPVYRAWLEKLELSHELLTELGFVQHKATPFEGYELMSYFVKEGVVLFYNPGRTEYELSDYLIGYAQMRQGKYLAVDFQWIKTADRVIQIYEAIHQKPLVLPWIKKNARKG
jgi:hypothetical protein